MSGRSDDGRPTGRTGDEGHSDGGSDGDLALHRLHDGDLSSEERAALEAGLHAEAREKLAALGELRTLLRGTLEAESAGVDLWAGVSRGLVEAPVSSLGDERARRVQRRRRLRPLWISTALAAAAALLLALGPWRELSLSPSNGCEIEAIDVTGATPTVLRLDDEHGGGSSTVIWLEED